MFVTCVQASLLRNLRARLAACHTPNSNIRRDLAAVAGTHTCRHIIVLMAQCVCVCICTCMTLCVRMCVELHGTWYECVCRVAVCVSMYVCLHRCVCVCVVGNYSSLSLSLSLSLFLSGKFQKRWQSVEECLSEWEQKHRQLHREKDQLDHRYKRCLTPSLVLSLIVCTHVHYYGCTVYYSYVQYYCTRIYMYMYTFIIDL